jgi:ribokinase
MSFDIITVGSATLDHFIDAESLLIRIDGSSRHEQIVAFPLGSKLPVSELTTMVGGGGTNSAVAFSRLGFKTAYLGKIGNDYAGNFVINTLKQEGIPFIGSRNGQTGFSVVLDSINKDHIILSYKGTNNHLLPHDIQNFNSPWIYLSSMLEHSLDTVIDLIISGDFKVAFNPSNYQAELGYLALSKLVDKVDILIMNREEACKFLGKDYLHDISIHDLLLQLYELPPKIVAITDGAQGTFVYDGINLFHGKPSKDLKVTETTGAGDAFSSTFSASIIKGLDTKKALDYAMTNAESVIQYTGAKTKLLTWNDLACMTERNQRVIEFISS